MKEALEKEKNFANDKFLSLALDRLRKNYFSKREKIEKLYDIEALREEIYTIKSKNLIRLKQNLQAFIDRVKENADDVILVSDKEEARKTIEGILNRENVKTVVKSKSLTTEEIQLNEFLIDRNFGVVETDIGEWLVQINNELPTHMTAPAIHMPKEKINELLNKVFNVSLPVDPKAMVDFCKTKIREAFFAADCGIIGANVASAESGNFFVLSNEGNIQNVIRKSIVICILGIDKIVRTDEEAFKILEILPKVATGQITTSYIDVLKRPFGKFYVVLIDNGRGKLASDDEFSEILHCIHCGACQNACPVYTTVSGKLFRGRVYAGPVGLILSYAVGHIDNIREYANMCIGCMACDEICSAKIKIQKLILTIKAKYTKKTSGLKGFVINHFENHYYLLRLSAYISHFFFKNGLRTGLKLVDESLGLNFRALPGIHKSFDVSIVKEPSNVCLFAGCSVNFMYPEIGRDALDIAEKLGFWLYPVIQRSCCGAPAWYNGEKKSASEAADINIDYLLSLNCQKILFLDPHCAHMIKRDYGFLSGSIEAKKLAEKIDCAGSYFVGLIKKMKIRYDKLGAFIGYHHPCHLKRGLGGSEILEDFLRENEPNFVDFENSDRCCGFAGSYSIMHPFISKRLLNEKMDSIKKAKLQVLVTACPGCMMQISGGFRIKQYSIEILHFVSYLNRIIPKN